MDGKQLMDSESSIDVRAVSINNPTSISLVYNFPISKTTVHEPGHTQFGTNCSGQPPTITSLGGRVGI